MARTIRGFAIDGVNCAGSGHAGTAMGCAEIGASLYGFFLRYRPNDPHWINRDRFILSAGHASILQYSCLHLAGFKISIADLRRFRQIDSNTPSHPQYRTTEGVETTTGVDGQGIAHGVGQALGLKIFAARFNRPSYTLFDAKVVVLAGDGCFMEGISHEASALAGHWGLDNLILIYDRNKTSLDGYVSESCSENTERRYQAYGWSVDVVDGHDTEALVEILDRLRSYQDRPALVIADTTIGKGAPTLAGSFEIHHGPLPTNEWQQTKKELGLPIDCEFYVPHDVKRFFAKRNAGLALAADQWQAQFLAWQKRYPELATELKKMEWGPSNLEALELHMLKLPSPLSGRMASHLVLQYLAPRIPALYGGSADLARSDMTYLHDFAALSAGHFLGRNIKYGVREFGMGGLAIGLAQTGLIPYVGTFLAFSDYMLSAIRMAALMRLRVIYQFTHDSIWIGQDGPTHQPVEHLAYLRAIPHLQVIRPGDSREVIGAWRAALEYEGPTALILSRQELPCCCGTDVPFAEGVGKGAYVIEETTNPTAMTLIATGSELSLAFEVAALLKERDQAVRIVSMPSWDRFEAQPEEYRVKILGKGLRVSIEAASTMGWPSYAELTIGVTTFGLSATPKDLAIRMGLTPEAIVERILLYHSQEINS